MLADQDENARGITGPGPTKTATLLSSAGVPDHVLIHSEVPIIQDYLTATVGDFLPNAAVTIMGAEQFLQRSFDGALVIIDPTSAASGKLSKLAEKIEAISDRLCGVLLLAPGREGSKQFVVSGVPCLRLHGSGALRQVLSEAASGRFPPGELVLPEERQSVSPSEVGPDFTRRETEVLAGIIRGRRNREIAIELGIAESTVRGYLTSIFDKTGIRSKHGLVVGLRNRVSFPR